MGTHCYIGIEDKNDKTVCYVYVHYDGYFSSIVPILRKHYLDRKKVESLIKCGDMSSILLPDEWFVNKDKELLPKKVENRYVFESISRKHIEYFYLFNKDDKWECQSTNMFDMNELKEY